MGVLEIEDVSDEGGSGEVISEYSRGSSSERFWARWLFPPAWLVLFWTTAPQRR